MDQTLSSTVEFLNGMAFRATSSSGHSIDLDASADVGGMNRGPRPMELFLLGLGGCTGMDVISILRKMRQDVTAYSVRVHGERADEHPRVFTDITVEHVVRGRGVNPDLVRKAVELSATRYCPGAAMLGKVARIEESYRIVDEISGDETTGQITATAA
jgi:putative redox protein